MRLYVLQKPVHVYIESKETEHDRFDFPCCPTASTQGYSKVQIQNCFGIVIVLFASHKRAFILNIQDIDAYIKAGKSQLTSLK